MSGSTGLAISDVVSVSVNLTQTALAVRNFGALCIVGPSDVIPLATRLRAYTSITGVAGDFGTTAPEYIAAADFFAQSPQPSFCYIGRWNQTASKARLTGGYISPANQITLLAALQVITAGSFALTINGGAAINVTGMNFASAVSMNQVASIINTALSTNGTCVWDSNNNQFVIRTTTSGATATINYLGTAGTGTDISALIEGTLATGATLSQGGALETPLACVSALMTVSNDWYGLIFAPINNTDLQNSDHLAIAALIEAASPARIYGLTSMNAGCVSAASTTDIMYLLNASTYKRTCSQYSSSSPYAIASLMGRGFTVDFTANNTTITLNGKVEPSVVAETLSESQAAALKAKCGNVFVNYEGGLAFIQFGTMANGFYFDEIQGTDWLANNVQTALFNAIINAPTKIPQTDPGIHQLVNVASAAMQQGVTNGLLAPGVWNGPPTGTVKTGDTLPNGYYVYAAPVSSQTTADRQARKSPTIQILCCLAGAVHSANVLINVQR